MTTAQRLAIRLSPSNPANASALLAAAAIPAASI